MFLIVVLYVNSKELDPYVCKRSLMCMWMHWIKTGESDRWTSESQGYKNGWKDKLKSMVANDWVPNV